MCYPAYIHHVLNYKVFNINICRFSTSRPVFDINDMFSDKRFNSNEMATSYRNSIWRHPPSLNLILVLISDSTVAFYIKFATSPPSLVRIGHIAKTLQKLFAIQDGGSRHLAFGEFAFLDDTVRSNSDAQHSHQIWCALVK